MDIETSRSENINVIKQHGLQECLWNIVSNDYKNWTKYLTKYVFVTV